MELRGTYIIWYTSKNHENWIDINIGDSIMRCISVKHKFDGLAKNTWQKRCMKAYESNLIHERKSKNLNNLPKQIISHV